MTVCPNCGHELKREREPLTEIQKYILDYIVKYIDSHGIAPTFEEIQNHFGYRSIATVAEHIANLEQRGWIKRKPGGHRHIVVLEE